MALHPRPGAHTFGPIVVLATFVLTLASFPAQGQGQRSTEPRIGPLESSDSPINILKTMANHPELTDAWGPFGGYILRNNTMPPRDREMVILRTAYLCGAEYEWGHHSNSARGLGMTDEEINNIALGPHAKGWSSFERALLLAADELHNSQAITDRTWAYIDARYDTKQMMDLVFTIGQYNMVAMAINSFRVPMDEGIQGFPD